MRGDRIRVQLNQGAIRRMGDRIARDMEAAQRDATAEVAREFAGRDDVSFEEVRARLAVHPRLAPYDPSPEFLDELTRACFKQASATEQKGATMADERYCDDPHCRRPVDPLSPGDAMAVHPKARMPSLGTALDTVTVSDQVWSIHPSCYSPSRHVPVRAAT